MTDASTLMWETRAADGRLEDLVAYALEHADPAAQVYRSGNHRVVVVDPTGHGLPEVPGELVARPPHVWAFAPVER